MIHSVNHVTKHPIPSLDKDSTIELKACVQYVFLSCELNLCFILKFRTQNTITIFALPPFSPIIPEATDLFTIPHFLFLSKITLQKNLPHLNFGISNYAICDKAWLGILLKKPLWLQQANNAYFSWKAFLRKKQKITRILLFK